MKKLLAALLASTLILAACGGGGDGGPDPSEDPQGALVEAFRDLAEGDGSSITVSVDSNEESLRALFDEGATPDLPDDITEVILDSSFTFGFSNESNPEDATGELIFELGGEEAAAITIDGYDLYAHADVAYMLETFGEDPARIDEAMESAPPQFDFIGPFLQDEWIHLTGLEEFAQQAEASGGDSPADISAQQKRLVEEMSTALEENSEITEGDEEGPGTHLEAKIDMQGLVESFEDVTAGLVPMSGLEESSSPDVPEGEAIIDAWVDDGTLKQIEFDFVKNAEIIEPDEPLPDGVDEFGILIEFDDFDGDVEVPDDATEVSVEELMQAMLGATGFGATGGSEDGMTGMDPDVCNEIANLPPEQQEAFKDICP